MWRLFAHGWSQKSWSWLRFLGRCSSQNRKGQTLASQIFPSVMSAPSNSLNRQKSQKPSTLDSVNDLASLISLAYLSTETARESQPCTVYLSRSVRLMFVPDVTVVGESIHHKGPYGGRKQTPVAYPNTCSESFWQNSQNKKQGCVKSVLSVMHSRSQLSL